jgi:transcriptional regulator with XRE-family HTH domain
MQMVVLGERLQILRQARNLTQITVANIIGVSKAMISSYELSSRLPSYKVLVKLAAFYNVSADYLLGLETKRSINVEGLNEKELGIITEIIEVFKNK